MKKDFSQGARHIPLFPKADNEYREVAWGILDYGKKFEPFYINRPLVTSDYDVKFEMLYCGICHTDCHIGLNQLGNAIYPVVPGHELIGRVVEIGSKVTKVKVGDNIGVGCISDCCLNCKTCEMGDEQYCLGGKSVHTYNDKKRYNHIGGNQDQHTFGGYSGSNVLHEHFIIKIPESIPLDQAAPILCAGITMYDPLRYYGATKGEKMTIGVVGIGGLGTMGIKLAKALGHKVVAISTSANKKEMAMSKGADEFVVSKDPESMKSGAGKCDLILNTVSAEHQVAHYVSLLRYNGTICQLGLVKDPHQVNQLQMIVGRKQISGSHIGGIKATEECFELCAKANIIPETKLITAD